MSESRNYLRKCPYCGCFFFSAYDLRLHAKVWHGIAVDDVALYNLVEEASARRDVKFVYEYKFGGEGVCELYGKGGSIYYVGTHYGTVLKRCGGCLESLMLNMRKVRFVSKSGKEPVRGRVVEESGQASLG